MTISASRRLLPIVLATVLLSACSGIFGERGSGDVITETRDVSGFDSIALEGTGTVQVEFGDSESLVIEAEDNLMPLLSSEVRGGTLVLGATRTISPTEDIVYAVTAVGIDSVDVAGSGDVIAPDVESDDFEAEVSGSGGVFLTDLDTDQLMLDVSGSGQIEVSGIAGSISVRISGSGGVDAEALAASTGTVSISGSGDAVVNVTDHLDAEVAGSGSIEYTGNPTVESEVSGSGKIDSR